jgi:choline dehydrogenase-like flavoprotein
MKQDFDVVIIGSGASGGTAAYVLAQQGVKCLLLEAGPALDFEKGRSMRAVSELPYHGFGTPGRFPHVTQASEFDENLWLDEKQNPYSFPANDPYYWVRMRLLGGKTLRWGRASWRLSNYELKAKDHDGFGDNWPVSYEDLAPYYDKAEPLLRVAGRNEDLPQLPNGKLLPDDSIDSQAIQRFIASARKLNVPTTKPRRATGTLASSINLLLPTALATGNLTVVGNAMVREIKVDPNTGLVNGLSFVDRRSKREYQVPARILIVGASTLESTRLLLNSKSPRYPNGLGNSSGVLGHYLFDQIYVKGVVTAVVPEARGGSPARGLMGGAGYVVRFRNINKREPNFLRGYTYDFGCGFTPGSDYFPQYGEPLAKTLADVQGAGFSMTTMGEVLARFENHVRIDPVLKDDWGIPSLHITQKYSANEHAMAKDSMEMGVAMCQGAGFEVIGAHSQMVPPGESIHELGTCRMGANPKTSVLNSFNQSHDVKNLFVVDGSSFVSGGAQNPTLTIVALTMRACDYLIEQKKKGSFPS